MGDLDPKVLNTFSDWYHSPLLFVKECLKITTITDEQAEALHTFPKQKKTTIRSGHGCGKDALAVWLGLWFMSTRPYAKVVVTAPTTRQLFDIYRSELAKWLRGSILEKEFTPQKDVFFKNDHKKDWWLRFLSVQVKASKEEQAETLAGLHDEHLLIIVDEASGVPDPTFIPLEGALTKEDNYCLLIGNMTRNSGYFYDSHFNNKLSKAWKRIHWNSEKSANVKKSYIDYMANKYGVNSSVYAVRVLGDPPMEDEDTLIPLAWARQCLQPEIPCSEDEPIYLAVDVARFGSDCSIIMPRQGLNIKPWTELHERDTMFLGGRVNETYQDLEANGIAIDSIGVGAGVTDWLQKHGHVLCFGVNVSSASNTPDKYYKLRDELWGRVRENCRIGAYSFPETKLGEELCNELAMPKYEYKIMNGALKVESKADMKKRGYDSPNIADALCLSEYFAKSAYRVWKKPKVRKERFFGEAEYENKYGWMVA